MLKQTQQSEGCFQQTLKRVNVLLEEMQLEESLQLIQKSHFENKDKNIQISSLKGYILLMQKKYNLALQIFNQCIEKKPYHLASKKRKALALQKLGEHQQCLKQFQNCLLFEPESKSIKNKIKRLCMSSGSSARSESASSQGGVTNQQKIQKMEQVKQQQVKIPQTKPKTQSVKFGNFQVIEVAATQDSDEHFALIKQQINKLSNKKPKKSILKDSMSAGIFKQKPKQKIQVQQKVEQTQKTQNQQQQLQLKEKVSNQAKPLINSIKKKSKSVTFKGDTNLQDFN